MMSIRPALAAAGAAALLAICPSAHASPVAGRGACDKALAVAGQAEHDYQALKRELQRIVADGGHPDASQRQALGDAEAKNAHLRSEAAPDVR
ncbi:hypothetical protein [Streptomyces sp. Caat 7-52]|uniref:hypothetical protein n=1 Tax=Streptomyces sp. Caat 7-52 TaxID=2949637 RepID=UPI002034C07F|nr:hypothetical protein [Streptomyces sp. Caat 7-52]